MEFILRLNVSGKEFSESLAPGMVDGASIGFYLNEVANQVDGHSMPVGKIGEIISDENSRSGDIIGFWEIKA